MSKENVKYLTILTLVGVYFIVQIVVAMIGNSMALKVDSIHMLSDWLALLIAFISYRLSLMERSHHYTYGLVRAEIVGGMINATFLISSAFFLLIETIQKLVDLASFNGQNPTLEKEIDLVIYTACGGLIVNIIGMVLFHQHSHQHSWDEIIPDREIINYNQAALMLHILGDFLGSLVVIITSILVKYTSFPQRFYLDPIASAIIIIVISISSIKLLRDCVHILLHRIPSHIDVNQLLTTIQALPMISNVHEFHLWSLTSSIVKATFHVKIRADNVIQSDQIVTNIKNILHQYGIHSSSIQLEWDETCLEPRCRENCHQLQCCTTNMV